MNTKRIRKLAEQAKPEFSQWLGSKPAIFMTQDELEKFAELIVRECADIVANSSFSDAYSEPVLLCIADDIKKHFGVKE